MVSEGAQSLFARFRRAVRAFEQSRDDVEDSATWKLTAHVFADELDGGWVAECVDLPGCMSQGDTQDEAIRNLIDAVGEVLAERMTQGLPDLTDDDDHQAGERQIALSM